MYNNFFVNRLSPPGIDDEIDYTPEQGALSLTLTPTLDADSGLAGFLPQLSGEAEHDFSTPPDLRRTGLGENFTVRLVGT